MKMFGKKSVSTVLFFITRAIVICCFVFILFLTFSFLSDDLITVSNGEFNIKLPLTDSFIKGQYDSNVIISIFTSFIFYGFFFYVLSLVFKVFKQNPIFSNKAISYLSLFTSVNILACLVLIGINFFVLNEVLLESMVYGMMHIILAIFVAFITAIFKQGFQLQQENDLTI